jgi:isoleucyl-tRNA synthetase
VLDRYLLARTHDLVARVTTELDAFDVAAACEAVREHLDVLTNWYVRTQRDRFWAEDADAFDTLAAALEALTRVMAPLAPMVAEEVWRGLTGGRSVHLTDWPATADGAVEPVLVADPALVAAMDAVREVVSAALGLRKANGLRVRQPLSELAVAVADPAAIEPYTALLAAELNVKHVTLVDVAEVGPEQLGVETRLAVNARAAGPRLGKAVQQVIRAAKAGGWTASGDTVVVRTGEGDVTLEPAEYELTTVVADGAPEGQFAAVLREGGVVLLDTSLDDALVAEGWARDVVRLVQDERKAAGLQVGDRIALTLTVPADRAVAIEAHRELISSETLAVALEVVPGEADEPVVQVAKVG